jgi:N-acetylglutamate synthase-like GNAT family acetyltransferase
MLCIRSAHSDDLPKLAEVINAAFQVERRFKDADRTSVPELISLSNHGVFLVGEEDGEIIACVFIRMHAGTGYFGLLAVDPARQGSGHGKRMREAAETYCRDHGCTEMTLRTVNVREELPPYYQKFGYRIVGTEPVDKEVFNQSIHFVKMAKAL